MVIPTYPVWHYQGQARQRDLVSLCQNKKGPQRAGLFLSNGTAKFRDA
jgi:hypothetical protein